MQPSIFTKIIQGEVPSYKVYEDEVTFAFLDINPTTPGHTLVVPKKQVEFLWDLDDETYQAVQRTAKRLARHLRTTLSVPYVGVQVVGVDVPHAHIHLIPFTQVDQFHARPKEGSTTDHKTLAQMAERLKLA